MNKRIALKIAHKVDGDCRTRNGLLQRAIIKYRRVIVRMSDRRFFIPPNDYCYQGCRGTASYTSCPYWSVDKTDEEFGPNGQCSWLGTCDKDIENSGGTGLLWDQIKMCGE